MYTAEWTLLNERRREALTDGGQPVDDATMSADGDDATPADDRDDTRQSDTDGTQRDHTQKHDAGSSKGGA